jgi:hypothetical protein
MIEKIGHEVIINRKGCARQPFLETVKEIPTFLLFLQDSHL